MLVVDASCPWSWPFFWWGSTNRPAQSVTRPLVEDQKDLTHVTAEHASRTRLQPSKYLARWDFKSRSSFIFRSLLYSPLSFTQTTMEKYRIELFVKASAPWSPWFPKDHLMPIIQNFIPIEATHTFESVSFSSIRLQVFPLIVSDFHGEFPHVLYRSRPPTDPAAPQVSSPLMGTLIVSRNKPQFSYLDWLFVMTCPLLTLYLENPSTILGIPLPLVDLPIPQS